MIEQGRGWRTGNPPWPIHGTHIFRPSDEERIHPIQINVWQSVITMQLEHHALLPWAAFTEPCFTGQSSGASVVRFRENNSTQSKFHIMWYAPLLTIILFMLCVFVCCVQLGYSLGRSWLHTYHQKLSNLLQSYWYRHNSQFSGSLRTREV